MKKTDDNTVILGGATLLAGLETVALSTGHDGAYFMPIACLICVVITAVCPALQDSIKAIIQKLIK